MKFEHYLFGNSSFFQDFEPDEYEFYVDRIVILPLLRPFSLDKAIELCLKHSENNDFRMMLLEKIFECPVLLYRLFKKGFYNFDEIMPVLQKKDTYILCHYFRKEIYDFNDFVKEKRKPTLYHDFPFENETVVNNMVEFGFKSSSIEFCLKYDDVESMPGAIEFNNKTLQWSPFEWSRKPRNIDILSFSSYFGSIRCFKLLLLNGYKIINSIEQNIVSSGSFDLFHLSNISNFINDKCLSKASEYCHLSMLLYLIEHGATVNPKINSIEINFLNGINFKLIHLKVYLFFLIWNQKLMMKAMMLFNLLLGSNTLCSSKWPPFCYGNPINKRSRFEYKEC